MDSFNRNSDLFSIEVDEHARVTFLEMARWTKFLAILGFIGLGLMVAGGMIFAFALTTVSGFSTQFSSIGATGILLLYLLVAAVCLYPFYGMLKYSNNMKAAIATQDKTKFNTAIVYLKNVFRYYGIIAIIILCIYGILLILGILIGTMK